MVRGDLIMVREDTNQCHEQLLYTIEMAIA